MNFELLQNPDYLYEFIRQSNNLDTVRKLCLTNRRINRICREDDRVRGAISEKIAQKQKLIQNKVDRFISSRPGISEVTLFQKAIMYNDPDIISELLKRGYKFGHDTIDLAVSNKSSKLISIISNISPKLLLQAASKYKRSDIINQLLNENKVNLNDLFMAATATRRLDIIEPLIQNQQIGPQLINQALIDVSDAGRVDIVDALLQDKRIDPNAVVDKTTALGRASMHEWEPIIERLLLDPRVNPSANENEAFELASINGRLNIVNRLLQNPKIDPTTHNNYSIKRASQLGHVGVVKRLLSDQRVRNTLLPEEISQYTDQINIV